MTQTLKKTDAIIDNISGDELSTVISKAIQIAEGNFFTDNELDEIEKETEEKKRNQVLEYQRECEQKRKDSVYNSFLQNVPPKYINKEWDDWKILTADHGLVKNSALEIFNLKRVHFSLWCGETSRGKSHLAWAGAKDLSKKGYLVKYLRFNEIASRLSRPYCLDEHGDEVLAYDYIDRLRKYKLVIIDDYNTSGNSEFISKTLFELLDNRICYEKDTLIISNLNKMDFAKSFGFFWNKINSRVRGESGRFVDFSIIPEYKDQA